MFIGKRNIPKNVTIITNQCFEIINFDNNMMKFNDNIT